MAPVNRRAKRNHQDLVFQSKSYPTWRSKNANSSEHLENIVEGQYGHLRSSLTAEHSVGPHQEAHRKKAKRCGKDKDKRDERVDVRREAKAHHRPEPHR